MCRHRQMSVLQRSSHPKITQLHRAMEALRRPVQQHIHWLQVPVDHSAAPTEPG
eukprot:CAMPEP_0204438290 /NCGR_PEP_ID=MMETSP0470-20130426/79091_1 /ASSEMBLY_ACC=CAM_ASM_000385 /TAXON_ID=2969 /ORGANISM="Oxyrrhis marina" /LENGTH=53 /DNA_ID=CAMNT_0051437105 /DNA_START=335 /DNA_END=496 /DNA_ORIENTATION=+